MLLKKFKVESLLRIGVGAEAGEKRNPEPVKKEPAPQHWAFVPF